MFLLAVVLKSPRMANTAVLTSSQILVLHRRLVSPFIGVSLSLMHIVVLSEALLIPLILAPNIKW